MKQSRERKTVVPLAKKGMTRNNQGVDVGKVGASHKKQTIIVTTKGDQEMETTTGSKGFEIRNVSEDVARFIKFSFDATFESIAKVQKFNETVMRDTIEAGRKAQAEAEKVVNDSIETGKKYWNEYRKTVENGFKTVEEMIQSAK